ncbi:MAG: hypothetical protein ACFFHD_08520 [Promethearchaeota archaeon]
MKIIGNRKDDTSNTCKKGKISRIKNALKFIKMKMRNSINKMLVKTQILKSFVRLA